MPPGNAPGETKWQGAPKRAKSEIKLTAGKAINVPIEKLVDGVVKENKVWHVDVLYDVLLLLLQSARQQQL